MIFDKNYVSINLEKFHFDRFLTKTALQEQMILWQWGYYVLKRSMMMMAMFTEKLMNKERIIEGIFVIYECSRSISRDGENGDFPFFFF